jgi:hypothetical protein
MLFVFIVRKMLLLLEEKLMIKKLRLLVLIFMNQFAENALMIRPHLIYSELKLYE